MEAAAVWRHHLTAVISCEHHKGYRVRTLTSDSSHHIHSDIVGVLIRPATVKPPTGRETKGAAKENLRTTNNLVHNVN